MYDQFLPLILFGIATAFTPGPNNILSSYSGFNFGFKKTIPLMLGVILGWTTMLTVMASGLIIIFQKYVFLQSIIKTLGTIFLIPSHDLHQSPRGGRGGQGGSFFVCSKLRISMPKFAQLD